MCKLSKNFREKFRWPETNRIRRPKANNGSHNISNLSVELLLFFFSPPFEGQQTYFGLYVESRIHLVLIDLITAIADNIIKNKSIWSWNIICLFRDHKHHYVAAFKPRNCIIDSSVDSFWFCDPMKKLQGCTIVFLKVYCQWKFGWKQHYDKWIIWH